MARDFDGSNQIIDTGDRVGPAGGYTVSAWIRPISLTSSGAILSAFSQFVDNSYVQFFKANNGQVHLRIHDADANGDIYIGRKTANGALTDSVWQHVFATWDGTTNNSGIEIWVDNVQKDDADDANNTFTGANTGTCPWWIGGQEGNSEGQVTGDYEGRIAEVAAWSDVLTKGFRTALSNGASPHTIRPDILDGYWPLYGLASPEPDLSGNKRNGTIVGPVLANHAPIVPYSSRFWGRGGPLIEVGGTTFFQTVPATAVGVTVLNRVATHIRALDSTAVGIPVISKTSTFLSVLSSTAVGVAVLTKKMFVTLSATVVGTVLLDATQVILRALSATAVGVATMAQVFIGVKTLNATAVGVPTIGRVATFLRTIAATAIGVPVITILRTTLVAIVATAVGIAVIGKKISITLAATAVGVATISTSKTILKSLTAVAVGVPGLQASFLILKSIVATAIGIASLATVFIPSSVSEATNVIVGRVKVFLDQTLDRLRIGRKGDDGDDL